MTIQINKLNENLNEHSERNFIHEYFNLNNFCLDFAGNCGNSKDF